MKDDTPARMWAEIEQLWLAIGKLSGEVHELRQELAVPRQARHVEPTRGCRTPVVSVLNLDPSDEIDAGVAARVLGISRAYFVAELSKQPNFPKPSANVSNKTRKWRYADILRVKANRKR